MAKHEKDKAREKKQDAKKQDAKGAGISGTLKSAVGAVTSAVGGTVAGVAQRLDEHPGGHTPAKAHGKAATIDTSLPATRAALLERHAEARRKRAAATLGSDAYREAADEIGRIEIRVAAVERAMTPPKG
jgi:hypothetical protein